MTGESSDRRVPDAYFTNLSQVRVVFAPSDELQVAVNEFVDPDRRTGYHALLYSRVAAKLLTCGGDSDGLRHSRRTAPDGQVGDAEWLVHYGRAIKTIHNQQLPVAAHTPSYRRLDTGALVLDLTLLPSEAIQQKLGERVLQAVQQGSAQQKILPVRIIIPPVRLVDDSKLLAAARDFEAQLQATDVGIYQPTTATKRFFATHPFVNDSPVN